MGKFDDGVAYYTHAKAEITIPFPEDEVCCKWCPYCYKDSMGRPCCRLTHKMVYAICGVDENCPIYEIEDVEKGEERNDK